MDINETARHFGITPDSVRKRISRGSLQANKVGGRWDVVLDTGQDKTGQNPGQQDKSSLRRGGDPFSGRTENPLVDTAIRQHLQEQVTNLQEQLRVMNQALSSRDNLVSELTVVIRQQQTMLPAARRRWWQIFRS